MKDIHIFEVFCVTKQQHTTDKTLHKY